MRNLFKNIYQNKRVLVTGNTGFKGSYLSLWLHELGAEVIGYSLEPDTNPNLFKILDLGNKIIHITGDIRDENKLKEVFEQYKPEIVFHLAAQALVGRSYKEPKLTYETNVMGTINVFEAARAVNSVRAIVNVTSDKCYENRELEYCYKESDPMGGFDPYSSSKGAVELVTSAYRNSFFNPKNYGKTHNLALASARAGNVIGGGDWAENRLIPDCIRSLSSEKELFIRNPESKRPWQHVLEPLSGYLWLGCLLLENGISYSEGWNFGPNDDDAISVEKVVKKLVEIWGSGNYRINDNPSFHEANLLRLDINKANLNLNWKPVYRINESLEKTANWYKNYYENSENMYEYTLNQIKEYVQKSKELGLDWSQD